MARGDGDSEGDGDGERRKAKQRAKLQRKKIGKTAAARQAREVVGRSKGGTQEKQREESGATMASGSTQKRRGNGKWAAVAWLLDEARRGVFIRRRDSTGRNIPRTGVSKQKKNKR